ncbi:MAG: translation elongation factor Ts [Candidatus Electryonea clarkiae]|nr:translation elongation factor Ts [Candidatus Electryonea clarkiae]MDP8288742.1 translation elongation factor Ts [Candidatus Electryonea clarkiae]
MDISAKDVMALRKKSGAGMMDCKKALKETEGDFDAAMKFLREKGMIAAKKRADKAASEGRVAISMNDDKTRAVIIEANSETDFVSRNAEFIDIVDYYLSAAMSVITGSPTKDDVSLEDLDLDKIKELAGRLGENLSINRVGCVVFDGDGFISGYIHPGDQLGVLIHMSGDPEALASEEAKILAHDLTLQIAASAPGYIRRDEVDAEVLEKEKEIYKNQMRNEGKPEAMLDKIADGKINKFFQENCLLEQEYVKETKIKVSARVKEACKTAGGELVVSKFLRYKVGEGTA